MTPQKMNCEQAKKIDIVTYLEQLNYNPAKAQGNDYWYYSPFHKEYTPSFKVNRKLNVWYDHSLGKGGNLVDFGITYHQCSVADFLEKLNGLQHHFSFHPLPHSAHMAGEKKEPGGGKIIITGLRPLQNASLLSYLEERKIPLHIARHYCKEVDFSLYGKQQTVIGFENRSGGFELRSPTFKGSSSPKDITFFDSGKNYVCVFEGFFNFLSFIALRQHPEISITNCLVLNSLSFIEKSRSLMEQHHKISLFLDRDLSGRKSTEKALSWNQEFQSEKYIDSSHQYKYCDDLNEWLIAQSKEQQQQRTQRGRGL